MSDRTALGLELAPVDTGAAADAGLSIAVPGSHINSRTRGMGRAMPHPNKS